MTTEAELTAHSARKRARTWRQIACGPSTAVAFILLNALGWSSPTYSQQSSKPLEVDCTTWQQFTTADRRSLWQRVKDPRSTASKEDFAAFELEQGTRCLAARLAGIRETLEYNHLTPSAALQADLAHIDGKITYVGRALSESEDKAQMSQAELVSLNRLLKNEVAHLDQIEKNIQALKQTLDDSAARTMRVEVGVETSSYLSTAAVRDPPARDQIDPRRDVLDYYSPTGTLAELAVFAIPDPRGGPDGRK